MQDTVEERLTAVRRRLHVDKPFAGTAISGESREELAQMHMMRLLLGMDSA
jgi:hypothetical protein